MSTIAELFQTELLEKLRKLARKNKAKAVLHKSLTEFHSKFSKELVNAIKSNFHKETDVRGNNFPILNTHYNDYKKGDPNQPILVDTGKMRDSINYRADTYGMDINHNTKYGDYHQYGMGNNPQRKFIPEDNNELKSFSQSVAGAKGLFDLDSDQRTQEMEDTFFKNVLKE